MCMYCEGKSGQTQCILTEPLDLGFLGQLLVDVVFDAESREARVNLLSPYSGDGVVTSFPISFCPACGRDLRAGGMRIQIPKKASRQCKDMEGTCLT